MLFQRTHVCCASTASWLWSRSVTEVIAWWALASRQQAGSNDGEVELKAIRRVVHEGTLFTAGDAATGNADGIKIVIKATLLKTFRKGHEQRIEMHVIRRP